MFEELTNHFEDAVKAFKGEAKISEDNVEAALTTVSCVGLDVSTGVESSPGKKDPEKIKEFNTKVRNFNG